MLVRIVQIAAAVMAVYGTNASAQTVESVTTTPSKITVYDVNCRTRFVKQANGLSKCSINCLTNEVVLNSRMSSVFMGQHSNSVGQGIRPLGSKPDGVDILVATANIPLYTQLQVRVFCLKP